MIFYKLYLKTHLCKRVDLILEIYGKALTARRRSDVPSAVAARPRVRKQAQRPAQALDLSQTLLHNAL